MTATLHPDDKTGVTVQQRSVTLPRVAVAEIDCEEHEEILAGLLDVVEKDLGVATLRVGRNAVGALVTLINTMSGTFVVASATT